MKKMKIVLGSSSPRRKQILGNITSNFDILHPDIDESTRPFERPSEYVKRIAEEKADDVVKRIPVMNTHSLIICCDTIVTIDDKIIGKPENLEDAVQKLTLLSGKVHSVMSGLTLLYTTSPYHDGKSSAKVTLIEETLVFFKNIDSSVIHEYLARIEYRDKAGSYAIQKYSEMIIQSVEGSPTNVVGFPLRCFFKLLNKLDILQDFLYTT